MSHSASRSGWALLILRLSVGLLAIHHGLGPLLHAKGSISLANAQHLAQAILELTAGLLFVLGAWMPLACVLVGLVAGWPLLRGWLHGAPILGDAAGLFRLLSTLASTIGGSGKWGLGKG